MIEETCTLDDLRGAEEAFIASTTRTVQPIASIDDLELPAAPGPVTLRHARRWTRRSSGSWVSLA